MYIQFFNFMIAIAANGKEYNVLVSHTLFSFYNYIIFKMHIRLDCYKNILRRSNNNFKRKVQIRQPRNKDSVLRRIFKRETKAFRRV